MRTSRRRHASIAASLAALATAVGLAAGAAPAQADEPLDYVALGDSFSAGSGVWPPDLRAPAACARSTANYPNVIADTIGADLTDVTCGGAQTTDFYESQSSGVAPQLDALTSETDLVTLTIGGNDNNTFIGALLRCAAAGSITGGRGNPCEDIYGGSFERRVEQTTYPRVRQALLDIQATAPQAKVAILGYPWILPAETGCFKSMPIARGDVPYLRSLQTTLNNVLQRAAAETGAVYVDFSQVSEGHDACQPTGTRWIEPLIYGTQLIPVHPNRLGYQQMANQTLATLGL